MEQEPILDRLERLFVEEGRAEYLGEPVTVAEHMLQCATLAAEQGASDALIAAALLHDIGHLTGPLGRYSPSDTLDRRHEEAGAALLAAHFQPVIVGAIRLHVAAKRYLCAIDPAYRKALSPASEHSLMLQGGVMGADEVQAFERLDFHQEAVKLRLWDDSGKDAATCTPSFAHFRPILGRMLDRHSS
jgi:phosphonate degradation associated HDIG domain protein